MQNDIVLTCAVTGAGDTTGKSAHVPVSPKDIAKAPGSYTGKYLKKLVKK